MRCWLSARCRGRVSGRDRFHRLGSSLHQVGKWPFIIVARPVRRYSSTDGHLPIRWPGEAQKAQPSALVEKDVALSERPVGAASCLRGGGVLGCDGSWLVKTWFDAARN